MERKVHFYKLTIKEIKQTDKSEYSTKFLNEKEVEKEFLEIYGKMKSAKNERRCKIVEFADKTYLIDVLSYDNQHSFLRIGLKSDTNQMGLIDRDTLETEEVSMKPSQLLQQFTFCLIDFETGIVSYIGINGAPRVGALKCWLNESLNKEDKYAELLSIVTDDIIDQISGKNIISKIDLQIAIPTDCILGDLGVKEKAFLNMKDMKSKVVTFSLSAKRNRNIFSEKAGIIKFMDNIRMKHGDNLKKASANAKDVDEKSQSYNLLKYDFTKTIKLPDIDKERIGPKDFKGILEETYLKNRDELLKYSRRTEK